MSYPQIAETVNKNMFQLSNFLNCLIFTAKSGEQCTVVYIHTYVFN